MIFTPIAPRKAFSVYLKELADIVFKRWKYTDSLSAHLKKQKGSKIYKTLIFELDDLVHKLRADVDGKPKFGDQILYAGNQLTVKTYNA